MENFTQYRDRVTKIFRLVRIPILDKQDQHAEVERLRAEVDRIQVLYDRLTGERFSDRVHLILHQRIRNLKEERDEALAQVAVLIQEAQRVVVVHEDGCSCQDGGAQNLPKLLKAVPRRARSMFDRLQLAEGVVEAAKKLVFSGFPNPVIESGFTNLRESIAAWSNYKKNAGIETSPQD